MKIIGHRGARGEAPENTLGGFLFALNRGVRHFELDVQLASDGVPVVIHDRFTTRTTRQLRSVALTSSTKLGSMNAAPPGAWPGVERVPTLYEVLPLLERSDSVQLELKVDIPLRQVMLVRAIRELLKGYDRQRYSLTSFDPATLLLARTMMPDYRRGLVCERRFVDNVALARRLKCKLIVFDYPILSRRTVLDARAAGLEVSCFTTNDAAQIRRLASWGVDSVITDYPVHHLYLGA
jgi:glycerophosphoryl diester phosphodiesterase